MKALFVALVIVSTTLLQGCGGGSDKETPVQKFTITTTSSDGGSISPTSIVVEENKTTAFQITPDDGYIIDGVDGCNGTLSNNTYTTGNIHETCTVNVSFAIKNYLVSASATEGGTISPEDQTIAHGEVAQLSVVAINNYNIDTVTGCDGLLNNDIYTTSAITENCSVTASFSYVNQAPTVNAGEDQTVEETETVTLQAEASDVDGVITTYAWEQLSGIEVTLDSPDTATSSFTIPTIIQSETLLFSLTVTDDSGLQATDVITINVNHINVAPTLSLGDDISVSEKSEVTLSATTDDIDGEITQYQWLQIAGDILAISDSNNSTLTLTIPDLEEEKAATFQLTVTDDLGATATDSIIVTMINDSEAPTNAKLVSVTSLSPKSISIDWLESEDNLASQNTIKYQVHASEFSGFIPDSTTLKATVVGTASYTINELTPNTTYFVMIVAEDDDANSSYSNRLSVKTMLNESVLNENQTVLDINNITITDSSVSFPKDESATTPKIGDIITSQSNNGILRKVISVAEDSESYTLETEAAAINDVYENLHISTSIKLVDIPEVTANTTINNFESKGLKINQATNNLGNKVNELNWTKSQLTLSQVDKPLQKWKTKQQSVQSQSNNFKASKKSYQEIKDKHLLMKGPLRASAQPGTRMQIEVSASVLNDENEELNVSEIEFVSISHHKIPDVLNNDYGVVDTEVTNGDGQNKRDIALYWTPSNDHVPTDFAQPFIATFKAKVRRTDCGTFQRCGQGTATLHVKIYVGKTDIPNLSDASFSGSGSIDISSESNFKFEPEIDIDADIQLGSLKSAHTKIQGNMEFDARLLIEASGDGSATASQQLFKKSFVKVLGTGVIVRGDFILTGELNGTATGKLSLEQALNIQMDFDVGFEYADGEWRAPRSLIPSMTYTITGTAEADIYAELRLVPSLKMHVNEIVAGHIKLEPYIYGEAGLEGEFLGIIDSQLGADFDADFRFTKANAGIGMDLNMRVALEVFDKTIAGWPSNDPSDFKLYTVLEKTPFVGLPTLSIDDDTTIPEPNSCVVSAIANNAPIPYPLSPEITLNNWVDDSANWDLYPAFEGDSIHPNLPGLDIKLVVFATLKNKAIYRLRYSGNSELGSWANQYEDIYYDFRDLNNDKLPDYWADKYKLSSADTDSDSDGLSNLEEFEACTLPNNGDSDNDGMPDGWEINNGLLPTINDANEDSDHDGRSNLSEFLDGTDPNVEDENPLPIVSAGNDQSVDEKSIVTFAGNATDQGGTIATVLWQQTSGTSVDINSADTLEATFTAPTVSEVEALIFTLTATDNSNAQTEDSVTITVTPVNDSPIANAGVDILVEHGTTVELDGSQSIDPDGTIVNYQWSVVNNQTLTIDNSENAMASFIAPNVTSSTHFEIQLTVTDDQGATDTDIIMVEVRPTVISNDELTSVPLDELTDKVIVIRELDDEGLHSTIVLNLHDSPSRVYLAIQSKDINTNEVSTDTVEYPLFWNVESNNLILTSDAFGTLTLTFSDGVVDLNENLTSLGDNIKVAELYHYQTLTTDSLEGYRFTMMANEANVYFDFISDTELFVYSQNSNDIAQGNWEYLEVNGQMRLLLDFGANNPYVNTFDKFKTWDIVSNFRVLNISLLPEITSPIDALVFSDASLADCVAQTAQTNHWLSVDQMTTLNCSNLNIIDATGISQLTALVSLDLSNNQLSEIDLSSNINITHLNLDNNHLTTIDFTNNSLLQYVSLLNNAFTQEALDYLDSINWIDALNFLNEPSDLTSLNFTVNISAGRTYRIYAVQGYSYNYTVDWGDDSTLTQETSSSFHTYNQTGDYTIKITGDFPAYRFCHAPEGTLLSIEQWGNIQWKSMDRMFSQCENLTLKAIDIPDLDNVTSMVFMFLSAKNVKGDISNWDVSNVTNLNYTFSNIIGFNFDISSWNVSSVTTLNNTFSNISDFNADLSGWDVSSTTSMVSAFSGTKNFNSDISSWDVSNVTNMEGIFGNSTNFHGGVSNWDISSVIDLSFSFAGIENFNDDVSNWDTRSITDIDNIFYASIGFNQDLSNWDLSGVTRMESLFESSISFDGGISNWDLSKVTSISSMFSNTKSFNADISSWDVSNITRMDRLFSNSIDFNSDVSNWDVSNVTSMSGMFAYLSNFNSDVSKWNVSNVTSMSWMFAGTNDFDNDLSNWNVINVKDMGHMFYQTLNYSSDLSQWNVSNVNSIRRMFYGSINFNSDLSNWDVRNVSNIEELFWTSESFNGDLTNWNLNVINNFTALFAQTSNFNGDISNWGLNSVTDMRRMFAGAAKFNSDISNWNVSNVTNMSSMFGYVDDFNGDLSNWNVSNVTNMAEMFAGAISFNSDISNWDVSNVANMSSMFFGARNFNADISNWDVGNVTNMSSMFSVALNFNGDISGWDVSNVTDMSRMFYNASKFNNDLSNWDVNNVTDMTSMFANARDFNGDISNWNTRSVTSLAAMFNNAINFNKDISNWDVSSVKYLILMFDGALVFNGDLANWNVQAVTDMSYMLRNATLFSGDLSNWDVSNAPIHFEFSTGSNIAAEPIWP